jgi:L-fucose:H+ symporter permease
VSTPPTTERRPLVARELKVPFFLLLLCFAAWGTAANLTDVLVGVFRSIFTMTNFESSLVQFAYYGAYFLLAIPAAMINQRFGFKAGLLTGLGLAAVGGFLFIPAANMLTYGMFLFALFTLAAGLSILETSANPLVIAMGDEATSTRRLNLAQAFNPIGANLGVLMGAVLILPHLTPETAKTIMSAEEMLEAQQADLMLVLRPYLGIATALVLIWLLIAFRRLPLPPQEAAPDGGKGRFGRLWANGHYRYGVIAQFFNVAAQTCAWTYTIIYAQDVAGTSPEEAGWWLQGSLLLFLVARFAMVFILGVVRPGLLLLIMAIFGVGCCLTSIFVLNIVGLIAVICISAALSLMFPTIYGLALKGLGDDAKFGSAGLVMAILGGATIPLLQAVVMDKAGSAVGFIIPAVCLALVAAYAGYDLTHTREEAS